MFKLFIAFLAVGASAYNMPAMGASQLSQSKLAGARASYTAPMPVAARSSEVSMSAITRRDADGNPITNFEMFDAVWMGIVLLPWVALLVANPF